MPRFSSHSHQSHDYQSGSTAVIFRELSEILESNRLFIQQEKSEIDKLQEEISNSLKFNVHLSWFLAELQNLESSVERDSSPRETCVRFWSFANEQPEVVQVTESYRVVGAHDAIYGELLVIVRSSPSLLALLLKQAESDTTDPCLLESCVRAAVCSLLGSLIDSDAERCLSSTLQTLLLFELADASPSQSPSGGVDAGELARRLRKPTRAFGALTKRALDASLSCSMLLVRALREPLLQMLTDEDCFLDVDPAKLPLRFSQEELCARFGEPSSAEYARRLGEHARAVFTRLADYANALLHAIRDALRLQPALLHELLAALYRLLVHVDHSESGTCTFCLRVLVIVLVTCDQSITGRQLARRLVLELLFGELFCAALSMPERHGVLPLELQLSASARHNLLQMATLLNTVASSTREAAIASNSATPPSCSHELVRFLYERLDWSVCDEMVELLLGSNSVAPSLASSAPSSQCASSRQLFLAITPDDLDLLVRTLRAGLKQHPRGVPAYGVAEALPRASDVEPVLALLAKVPVHVPGSSAARQQLMLLARPAPAAAGAMTAASSPGAPAHAASGAGGPLPGAPSASKGVLSATSESTARASSPLLSVRNSIGKSLTLGRFGKEEKRNSATGMTSSQQELSQPPQAIAKQSAPTSPVLPSAAPHRPQEQQQQQLQQQQQRKSLTALGLVGAPAHQQVAPPVPPQQQPVRYPPQPVTVLRFALTARPLEELAALAPILSQLQPPEATSQISSGEQAISSNAINPESLNNLDSELAEPEPEPGATASGEGEVPSLSGSSPSRSHSHTTGTGGPGDPLSDMVSGVSGSGHVSPSRSLSPSDPEIGLTGSARASPSSSVHNEILVPSPSAVAAVPASTAPLPETVITAATPLSPENKLPNNSPRAGAAADAAATGSLSSSNTNLSAVVSAIEPSAVETPHEASLSPASSSAPPLHPATASSGIVEPAPKNRKAPPSDVTERFLKFDEFAPNVSRGPRSSVSDEWSTDMIPSDSESTFASEATGLSLHPHIIPTLDFDRLAIPTLGRIKERTRDSDSWSLDVEASDVEDMALEPDLASSSASGAFSAADRASTAGDEDDLPLQGAAAAAAAYPEPELVSIASGDSLSSAQLAAITESSNTFGEDTASNQSSNSPRSSSRPLYEMVAPLSVAVLEQQLSSSNKCAPSASIAKPAASIPAVSSSSSLQQAALPLNSSTSTGVGPAAIAKRATSPAPEKNNLFGRSKASASNFLKTFKEKISKPISSAGASSAQHQSSSGTVRQRTHQSPAAPTRSNAAPSVVEKRQSDAGPAPVAASNLLANRAIDTISARVQYTPTPTATDSDNNASSTAANTSAADQIMEKYKSQAARSRNSMAEATRSSASLRSGEQIVFENGPASDGSSAALNVPLVKQRLATLLAQLVLHHRLALPRRLGRGVEDRESKGSESELVHLLRFLQAETASFKEAALAVSLQDAIRLCTPIPDPICFRILKSILHDSRKQDSCTALVREHQQLLAECNKINKLKSHLLKVKERTVQLLTLTCMRMFLEQREMVVARFVTEFNQQLLNDEKAECIQGFISQLFLELQRHSSASFLVQPHQQQVFHHPVSQLQPQAVPLFAPLVHNMQPFAGRSRQMAAPVPPPMAGRAPLSAGMPSPPADAVGGKQAAAFWLGASETQLEEARAALERALFTRVYKSAMFPNREADEMRDQILEDNISKLSRTITMDDKHLQIPKDLRSCAPWTAAQNEIFAINAYKSPREKLACVVRCAETIVRLIELAEVSASCTTLLTTAGSGSGSSASADSVLPVLIYVLVRANPKSLLSNIAYVQSFVRETRLRGADLYWFTQFISAVEFIKTMIREL